MKSFSYVLDQFPYSHGIYPSHLPNTNYFNEVSFDSKWKGPQPKLACTKSKLAYIIENQWVMCAGMAGSRDWAIHLGFVCPHLSVLLLCWFHSQAQWLWASPTRKARRGVQQFLFIMLLGSVLMGNDDLLVSRSEKTLLLHFPLFCVTVFGSQASSHAWSWANYGAGVWDALIDLGLVYVLWCDGYILSHLEWPD